ncbi:BID domain-containing T4SS effector [Bartonella taylorii]|uniref:BID domain-containing T4SS effector n=1 Tax=Bartonella taylorii TaxID=33046 RepID=UPI001ABA802B|nr:BID domain-containing T4SS effector [Bartonella taylorii]
MKKNQPNPEGLYATVNKQNRNPHIVQEVIYADVSAERGRGQHHPSGPSETVYADINFDPNGRRSPHKPVESVYAELGMSAHGRQNSEQLENPLYEGVGTGRTTPPRTPKDEITSKLLQNTAFQYGVRETQEWCKVVYGNEHALNHQLAQILENPQEGEKVLWSLAENPESVGKLAGRQMLGIKSLDRKQAEDGFSPLCAALERHIETAKKLHKDFTHEQERSQRHERGQSPERQEHRHHHRHYSQERGQNAPEHEAQHKHSPTNQKGMAFAM